MRCHELREIADSFLSDELTIETNHDVIEHLEACAACRDELEACRHLRKRLREACAGAPEAQVSEEFVERLRGQLQASASRNKFPGKFRKGTLLSALTACLIFAGERVEPATPQPYYQSL